MSKKHSLEKQIERNRIALLQYENLRKYFNENLIDPILGKDYYNYGCDAYSCDKMTTEDIKYKFNCLKHKNMLFKIICIISFIINIILFIILFIR